MSEDYGAGSLASLIIDLLTSEQWQPEPKEQKRIAYQDYIQSPAWQLVRSRALTRAGHKCQLCGGGLRLEVHHNTYARLGNELPTDLIVLCADCHTRYHREPGN